MIRKTAAAPLFALTLLSFGCSPQSQPSSSERSYPTCEKCETDTAFAAGTYVYQDGSDDVGITINGDSTLTYSYRGNTETVPIWLVKDTVSFCSGDPWGEKEKVVEYRFSMYPSKIAIAFPSVYGNVFYQYPRDARLFEDKVFFDGCVCLSVSLDSDSPKAAIRYRPLNTAICKDPETQETYTCSVGPSEFRFIRR